MKCVKALRSIQGRTNSRVLWRQEKSPITKFEGSSAFWSQPRGYTDWPYSYVDFTWLSRRRGNVVWRNSIAQIWLQTLRHRHRLKSFHKQSKMRFKQSSYVRLIELSGGETHHVPLEGWIRVELHLYRTKLIDTSAIATLLASKCDAMFYIISF